MWPDEIGVLERQIADAELRRAMAVGDDRARAAGQVRALMARLEQTKSQAMAAMATEAA